MSKDLTRDPEASRQDSPINGVAVAIVTDNRDPDGLAHVIVEAGPPNAIAMGVVTVLIG